MSVHPILFLGGSGAIGHRSAKALRAAHPDVPLLIGGRDLAKAEQAAEEMGGAQGVVIDPTADDLGLGDRPVGQGSSYPDPPTGPGNLYRPRNSGATRRRDTDLVRVHRCRPSSFPAPKAASKAVSASELSVLVEKL